MNIELAPAKEADRETVRNLFQFYIHDLSEFGAYDVADDGSYAVPPGEANYWAQSADKRVMPWPQGWQGFPYLLRGDGMLAGFALVKQIGQVPPIFDMGEFFVLRKFRRHGVGKYAAHALFDRHRGNWEIREMLTNLPAQTFWRKIIRDYSDGEFTERREHFEVYRAEFIVQRFRSGQGVG